MRLAPHTNTVRLVHFYEYYVGVSKINVHVLPTKNQPNYRNCHSFHIVQLSIPNKVGSTLSANGLAKTYLSFRNHLLVLIL